MSSTLVCNQYSIITDPALEEALWKIYEGAFAEASEECVQDQMCYNRTTFGEAMRDPDYLKFVASDGGVACGLNLCTKNLEKARVAYCNPVRLRRQFGKQYGDNIYYYTAIVVRPDKQGRKVAQLLIEAVTIVMDREGAISVMDHATDKSPGLPEFIAQGVRAAQAKSENGMHTNVCTIVPLGGQQYFALELTRAPDKE